MNISKEENFIICIIFNQKKIDKEKYKEINFSNLIKILSEHLIIPLFYYQIREKKLLNFFPEDFVRYIKKIYTINKNRNIQLIKESKQIKNLFIKNSLPILFTKGTAFILNDFYPDNGVRMIGDIDFLIKNNDSNKVETLLEANEYSKLSKYDFLPFRHLARRVNKKKLFAIEPHIYFTNKKIVDPNLIFCNSPNNYSSPSTEHMLINNIYNFSINDYGNLKLSYSYRSIYDTIILLKKGAKFNMSDKIIANYFIVINELGVENKMIPKAKKNLFYYKLKYLRKFKYMFKTYILLTLGKEKFFRMITKLLMLFNRKDYRDYLKSKFSVNKNKT